MTALDPVSDISIRHSVRSATESRSLASKGLQLTPNRSFQAIRGSLLAAGATAPALEFSAVWCS